MLMEEQNLLMLFGLMPSNEVLIISPENLPGLLSEESTAKHYYNIRDLSILGI